jgi:DNA transformation protein and related proteins
MSRVALVDHCLELLAPLGRVRSRRMFGGHGLYVDDLFIAIIAGESLYLKTDDATRPCFESAASAPFTYAGAGRTITLSYWSAPPDAMESAALMAPWGRLAVQAALAARTAVRPRRSRSRGKPAAVAGR